MTICHSTRETTDVSIFLSQGHEGSHWASRAACTEVGLDVFYRVGGSDPWRDARRICAGCPVVDECLQEALAQEAGERWRHGYRGGMAPTERADVASGKRRGAA